MEEKQSHTITGHKSPFMHICNFTDSVPSMYYRLSSIGLADDENSGSYADVDM